MRLSSFAFLILWFPSLLVATGPAMARSCDRIAEELGTARQRGQVAPIAELIERADEAQGECSAIERACLQRLAALTFRDAAHSLAARGASEAEVEAMLRKGLPFARPWQLVVDLADLIGTRNRKAATAYDEAARFYQAAVDDIVELPPCSRFGVDDVPTGATIAKISMHMQTAVLLASELTVTTNRSGRCGGIFEERIRGFTPKARPLPITFPYDSASLSPQGERSAHALLECVLAAGYTRIAMSGHTDSRGTDEYNLDLSSRRLSTVRTFLAARGYKGTVELIAKGESEPFAVDDPGLYSPEEIDQLNRRVELRESSK
jgi:outer membrane protein OmpA-like peptidoglycan-associated protein